MLFKVLLAGMCSLCLVGTATLASAHEFIVKPDKTQAAKGESVGVQAQAAQRGGMTAGQTGTTAAGIPTG